MNRKFRPALLAGSLLVVGVPMAAHAAPVHAEYNAALTLCVAEGAGHIIVVGDNFNYDTGRLQATVSGTDKQAYTAPTTAVPNGSYSNDPAKQYTVTTTPSCVTVNPAIQQTYTASAGTPLDGPCYRTTNGDLVNPPYIAGDAADPTKTPRCPGKVYEISMSVNGGPATVVHQDQFTFSMPFSPTKITFRITDVRYFDCISQTGPGNGTANNIGSADNGTICEPNGPTHNVPTPNV